MRIELDSTDLEPLIERVVSRTVALLGSRHGTGDFAGERLAYNRKEAAEALGISISKLDLLTKSGRIPHVRLSGDEGSPSYPVAMLERWLEEQAIESVKKGNTD